MTKESCKVTVENSNGQVLILNIENDTEKEELILKMTGTPINLKEHNGLHVTIVSNFIDALKLNK